MNLRRLALPADAMAATPDRDDRNAREQTARRATPQIGAVCWSAIFAGAAGATALSLILVVLGVGLGCSSVSPWSGQGIGATTFGMSTFAWLVFTQLAVAGVGGYLAGRLRLRWLNTDPDEVYFRDTAHGFLAWGVATLLTVALLTSVVGAVVSGAGRVAAAVPAAASASATAGAGYFVDSLFRSESSSAAPASAGSAAEVGVIFANATAAQALPADDAEHAARLIAQRTGLSQADAQARVTETFARMQAKSQQVAAAAREAADKARTAAAHASLWWFVSLLAGAFVASLAATYGGRRRDLF